MRKFSVVLFSFLLLFTGVSFGQNSTIVTQDSTATQPALSNEQLAKILAPKKPKYPRHLVHGFFVGGGYSSSYGIDLNIGFQVPISERWPVTLGFEILHAQFGAENFQTISDESLLTLSAGTIVGVFGMILNSDQTEEEHSPKDKEPEGFGVKNILTLVLLLPLYTFCGELYVPVVPGAWLGVIDKSRIVTQVVSEGFSKKSFTYQNDVGLRLSPIASRDGRKHLYADGGIRFEKNLADNLKFRYFVNAGVAFSI